MHYAWTEDKYSLVVVLPLRQSADKKSCSFLRRLGRHQNTRTGLTLAPVHMLPLCMLKHLDDQPLQALFVC